jgi:hypothetical protein
VTGFFGDVWFISWPFFYLLLLLPALLCCSAVPFSLNCHWVSSFVSIYTGGNVSGDAWCTADLFSRSWRTQDKGAVMILKLVDLCNFCWLHLVIFIFIVWFTSNFLFSVELFFTVSMQSLLLYMAKTNFFFVFSKFFSFYFPPFLQDSPFSPFSFILILLFIFYY